MICWHACFSLLFFSIGKSIDPDGVKAVNDDYIHRYIHMCEHYTGNNYSREEAIASITPYVDGREDIFLSLLSELMQTLPSKVDDVDRLMKQYIGGYDQMFLDLQQHVRELEIERNRLELLENSASTAAAGTSTSSYINSTSTSAIAPFVPTLGTSSLAAAAAAEAAKNNPPVVHGPVDIDLDNEVFGDDDYMPPPLVSGNKRRMNTRSNSNSALVLPDE
jgi:hypothetical protein